MLESITRTIIRLSGKIYTFNPILWYKPFVEGISIEFGRFKDYKDIVLKSLVPNDNMDSGSIEDHNTKYGIPQTLGGTDQEKINRIIEKASLNGQPGPDFLQNSVQMAGYQLYVIENVPLLSNQLQWGDFQWGTVGVQYGLTARFVDPQNIPGDLVVCSPPKGAGKKYLSQWGRLQYGDFQLGTLDPLASTPQPYIYIRDTVPKYWGYYFTLSPFSDRVATDSSEFLEVNQKEYDYLVKLIIQTKMLRNRCILQAKVV